MNPHDLTTELKLEAKRLGFGTAGVCPAVSPTGLHRFLEWLDAGYAGEMHFLQNRRDAYSHPRHVLEGARSLVMLTMCYRTSDLVPAASGKGQVSRYAWGAIDYHDRIHLMLRRLGDWLFFRVPGARVRGVVDTAPLLEREFAQLAGLGWIGKNTMLISRELGSWFFLAALLTDVVLEYDAPFQTDHCGTCRACLDACPTGAFPEPYVLDATQCISYLTIEKRKAIPVEQRAGIGDWLFGCDICQEACPWNNHAPVSQEPGFAPDEAMNPANITALFEMDDAAFRLRFRYTALWRAKRRGILRNAAIVLGNQRSKESVPALERGLNDCERIVREACGWALEQIDKLPNGERWV